MENYLITSMIKFIKVENQKHNFYIHQICGVNIIISLLVQSNGKIVKLLEIVKKRQVQTITT